MSRAWERHGLLQVLEIEGRTALLWEACDLGLDTLALDMMNADFDLVTSLLGLPLTVQATVTGGPGDRGSAAEVILGYPTAIARCASSPLMPQPYGVRDGWRATFTGAILEYAMRAGLTGSGPATLTGFATGRERPIDLPTALRGGDRPRAGLPVSTATPATSSSPPAPCPRWNSPWTSTSALPRPPGRSHHCGTTAGPRRNNSHPLADEPPQPHKASPLRTEPPRVSLPITQIRWHRARPS